MPKTNAAPIKDVTSKLKFRTRQRIWDDDEPKNDSSDLIVANYEIEFGYTPNNLRYLLLKHDVSREDCAKLLEMSFNQFVRCCQNPRFPDDKSAATLKQPAWTALLKHLGYRESITVNEVVEPREENV